MCLNINICEYFVSNMNIFHSLEVVGRGSATQLQLDENYIISQFLNQPVTAFCLFIVKQRYVHIIPVHRETAVND